MARDIEEFLRRAAERRKQQKAGSSPQAPPQSAPPQQQRRPAAPPQSIAPQPQQPRRLVNDPSGVEIIELSEQDMRDQSVAEHVSSHIDTSDISQHAEGLAERLSQVDEQTEARVHQHLDRDLSKLDDKPSVQDEAPQVSVDPVSPIAQELVEMLSKPKTIRQAILVNEILRRPNFD